MKKFKSVFLQLLLLSFTMILVIMAYATAVRARDYKNVRSLSSEWTVKLNNEIHENVNLDEFSFPITKKGDWIVMARVLPTDIPEASSLRINIKYTVTKVYVDEELIYEYGTEHYEKGELLGSGTRIVTLPEGSAGKTLKITLFETENNVFSSIQAPEIYETSEAHMIYYGNRMLPLVISITLVVAGFCIAIVTFCMYFRSYSMNKLFSIGILALCIGLWSLCSYGLDYLFVADLRVKICLEKFSLFLIPFPALLYFREDVERRAKRWESFLFYLFIIVEIQLYLLTAVFQFTNVGHLPEFYTAQTIFMIICVLFLMHLVVRGLCEEKSHKFLAIGFAVLIIISLRDLIMSILVKYSIGMMESHYRSYIAIGALCYVVALLADFIKELRKQLLKLAESKFLEKIAYEDVLTGLYTRRKCDEVFAQIDRQKEPFTIIQYDLNNLKNTNDDYGHEAGDELLIRFTNLLQATFTDGEILGRMGGDEFIVIVKNSQGYDVESHFKKFDELAEIDNRDKTVQVSASKGYCASTELENAKTLDVYKEADKRMYKDKEQYYIRTGKNRRRSDTQRVEQAGDN